MPADGSEILDIIGELHEGVVDDTMWQHGLDHICTMLGAPVMLTGAVSRGGRSLALELGGRRLNPAAAALLEGPLADPVFNPWMALAASHPLRRVATIEDVGGHQHFENSKMWRDFYVPFNICDSLGAVLERQPECAEVVVVGRRGGQNTFGTQEMLALTAILPHLARASRVRRALAEMEAMVGTLRFVLDRLDRAIVVTASDGEVRFANRAADRLLTRGDAIGAFKGRLRAARPHHTSVLRDLIERAVHTSVGAGSVAVDAVSLPSANDGPSLAVVAEPLAPGHSERLGHSTAPGAILFIGDSETSRRPPVERLQVVYGLTAAEAQLASLIAHGEGIAQAAATLKVSPNTVKYHLKTIFAKVGVERQTQLIRRVLADVGGLAEPEKLVPTT